jgi:hypothetical protein
MPATPIQPPVFVNGTDLGTIKEGDNRIISVTAYDPEPYTGETLKYSLVPGLAETEQLPPTLTLDTGSGYIYGSVSTQTSFLKKYSLKIRATKTNIYGTGSFTTTNIFNLSVRNSDNSTITWTSPGFLGTLTQGSASDLGVSAATNISVYDLQYRVVGSPYDLPQGLTLNTSGNIVGVVEASGIFTATVVASTSTYFDDPYMFGPVYPYPFSTQTITINVLPRSIPITNIYATPLMRLESRRRYQKFITDKSVFVPEMIYRSDDGNFGVQEKIKMNLEFGIQKLNLQDYRAALMENFNRRRLNFGPVKVARAVNGQGRYVYDVVYVDIIDDLEGATHTITINSSTYFPPSVENMRYRLENLQVNSEAIGIDTNNLPRFMNTAQQNNYLPLGYVKVVVLCYTLPTLGNRILSRIHLSKFDFKILDFEIDRLVIEGTLDNSQDQYLLFGK